MVKLGSLDRSKYRARISFISLVVSKISTQSQIVRDSHFWLRDSIYRPCTVPLRLYKHSLTILVGKKLPCLRYLSIYPWRGLLYPSPDYPDLCVISQQHQLLVSVIQHVTDRLHTLPPLGFRQAKIHPQLRFLRRESLARSVTCLLSLRSSAGFCSSSPSPR